MRVFFDGGDAAVDSRRFVASDDCPTAEDDGCGVDRVVVFVAALRGASGGGARCTNFR